MRTDHRNLVCCRTFGEKTDFETITTLIKLIAPHFSFNLSETEFDPVPTLYWIRSTDYELTVSLDMLSKNS